MKNLASKDFLKSLDVNEEASRALREAPKEVQRMMLQEVQDCHWVEARWR